MNTMYIKHSFLVLKKKGNKILTSTVFIYLLFSLKMNLILNQTKWSYFSKNVF